MSETKLEKLQKREAQIKEQIKQEKAKEKLKERKARTKRLIEIGAVVEKALNLQLKTPEDREKLLQILTKTRTRKDGSTWTYANLLNKDFKK